MTTDQYVGRRVHMLMWDRGLRQDPLARRIGMTQSALSKKVHGQRPWTADEIVRVARALDVEPAELLPAAEDGPELPRLDSNQEPAENRLRLAVAA